MKKADYSKIAAFYDKGRALSEQIIDLWLNAISRLSKAHEGSRLLDLGCGTGRFAIPLAAKLRVKVTGADFSQEMLEKAKEKDTAKLVKWDKQDAQNLTYPDNSFDVVFMSHLLHHCDNPDKVIRDCWRVLSKHGLILVRHGAIEQIRNDPEHTFFPEALTVDKARIFSLRQMEGCLKEAGFSNIVSEEITQQTYRSGADHLERVKLKNTSTLTLIPQDAFERGARQLEEYITNHPDDPWLLYDRMTLTAGYKRGGNKS
jgi:ubiquinone/menaquinone biosynthesis C-methylase UbiE